MLSAIALLLWGMRMVGNGVMRACGPGLHRAISKSTSNRFKGFAAGMAVTMLLQSSIATSLIVSSFATRGLLGTVAALAIMLGADVGTTIVVQVLSIDLSLLAPLLLLVGVSINFVAKQNVWRQGSMAMVGLALMLLALAIIAQSVNPLRESEALQGMFKVIEGDYLFALLVAAALTWLAHSSLAVVLLIISLAAGDVITLQLAIAMVLGANLGGTLPVLVANWNRGTQARRAPLGNLGFKLIGCIVLLPFIDELADLLQTTFTGEASQIANFHSLFNLLLAAVFIAFITVIGKMLDRMLPIDLSRGRTKVIKHLNYENVDNPSVALASATLETVSMGHIVEKMLQDSMVAIEKNDAERAKSIVKMDVEVDRLHEAIKLYITKTSREQLDEEDSRRIVNIITFSVDLENIGDIVCNLMEMVNTKIEANLEFSPEGLAEIKTLHQRVADSLQVAIGAFISNDVKLAEQLLDEKRSVRQMQLAGERAHFERLRMLQPQSIRSSGLHMDVSRDLKRIHSHIVAIAYPILEGAGKPSQQQN